MQRSKIQDDLLHLNINASAPMWDSIRKSEKPHGPEITGSFIIIYQASTDRLNVYYALQGLVVLVIENINSRSLASVNLRSWPVVQERWPLQYAHFCTL